MFAVFVLALLCLVSVGHSAPLGCEDLVRPLDPLNLHQLEGRRVLVAGSLNSPAHEARFKTRDTATINFANTNETTINYTRIFGFGDRCEYMYSNLTLEGSNLNFGQFNLTVTLIYTSCPDCVLMHFNSESKKTLYLFSRRREVDQKEMEELSAQAECMKLLPPVMMDPNKELCPKQSDSDSAAAQTEENQQA